MSALPPKADIPQHCLDVRFGPEADIVSLRARTPIALSMLTAAAFLDRRGAAARCSFIGPGTDWRAYANWMRTLRGRGAGRSFIRSSV
jgi:hypothetical protein